MIRTQQEQEWRVLCGADWHAGECSGAGPRAGAPQEAAELAEEAGWWHDTRRGRWICPHHLREREGGMNEQTTLRALAWAVPQLLSAAQLLADTAILLRGCECPDAVTLGGEVSKLGNRASSLASAIAELQEGR
jgi:hypothetical protein